MPFSVRRAISRWNPKQWACFLCGIVVVVIFAFTGLSTVFDLQITNQLFRKIGTRYHPSQEIVIVSIDDATLQWMQDKVGRWPWPRSQIAKLVEACGEADVVGLDILFLEGTSASSAEDSALGDAIRRHGRVVLVGCFASDVFKGHVEKPLEYLKKSLAPAVAARLTPPRKDMVEHFLFPIPVVGSAANRVGHANFFPSSDQIFRSYSYFMGTNHGIFSSFAAAVLLVREKDAFGKPRMTSLMDSLPPEQELVFYNEEFFRYPAIEVLNGRVPSDWAKGKVVLIGAEASGLYDLRATPMSGNMSGIGIHATAVSNALQQHWLRSIPMLGVFGISLLFALTPLFYWEAAVGPVLLRWGGILLIYLMAAAWLFYVFAFRLPLTQPLLAFAGAGTCRLIFWIKAEHTLRRRMEEIERLKKMLGNMLVHDLRSPMGSIVMLLQSIQSFQKEPKAKQRLDLAITEGERMIKLIQSLFEIQRLESGEMNLSRVRFSWNELISDVSQKFAHRGEGFGVRLRTTLPEENLLINGDRGLLIRVLVNLMENAFNFAEEESEVVVETFNKTPKENWMTVRVCNQGPIIDPSLRETLFESYVRGQQHGRREGERGLGLGLTFCKLAIVAHGGSIRCVSPAPNSVKGVCMEFQLPVYTGPSAL
jgi:signal transduction histidine kinase